MPTLGSCGLTATFDNRLSALAAVIRPSMARHAADDNHSTLTLNFAGVRGAPCFGSRSVQRHDDLPSHQEQLQ